MRGYGGGPNYTSLHPRHWDSTKTITHVPGIGYCRISEAIPYLRRLFDSRIREIQAYLADHAELEKRIDAFRGSRRGEMIRMAAENRHGLEEALASFRDAKARLGKRRRSS
jgi:hypothetical protein